MKKMLLPSLTKAINTYLELDPESTQRLQKMQGRAIAIELLPFHFTFQCVFTEKGVSIHADDSIETETQIRGTPLRMAGVMFAKEDRQRFFADDLVMEGNAAFGQQVIDLFDEMQIDWEEHFSRVVGDVSAHHIGRFVRGVSSWLSNTEKSFTQDINEYVHEEAELFPANEALKDFFRDIDTLRMDVDRVEARINHLRTSLADDEVIQ